MRDSKTSTSRVNPIQRMFRNLLVPLLPRHRACRESPINHYLVSSVRIYLGSLHSSTSGNKAPFASKTKLCPRKGNNQGKRQAGLLHYDPSWQEPGRLQTSSSRRIHPGDIAFEVQLQILQFCSLKDLTVVARVHSSLRDAAENALYSHIDFSPRQRDRAIWEGPSKSPWKSAVKETAPLLSTLARNARNASMVKTFYIELGGEAYDDFSVIPPILAELSGALRAMPNLMDLRIRTDAKLDRSEGKISNVIRSVCSFFR